MNTKVMREAVEHSLNGTKKFPEIVALLMQEGIESYHVDLVRSENRYYLPNGESHTEPVDHKHQNAALEFSAVAVQNAVKKSQRGEINYKQFVDEVLKAGTVYYITYLHGRKVIYFGRKGESHTEYFPGANS